MSCVFFGHVQLNVLALRNGWMAFIMICALIASHRRVLLWSWAPTSRRSKQNKTTSTPSSPRQEIPANRQTDRLLMRSFVANWLNPARDAVTWVSFIMLSVTDRPQIGRSGRVYRSIDEEDDGGIGEEWLRCVRKSKSILWTYSQLLASVKLQKEPVGWNLMFWRNCQCRRSEKNQSQNYS